MSLGIVVLDIKKLSSFKSLHLRNEYYIKHKSVTLFIIKQQSFYFYKYISTDCRQWATTVMIKRQFKTYVVTTIII